MKYNKLKIENKNSEDWKIYIISSNENLDNH